MKESACQPSSCKLMLVQTTGEESTSVEYEEMAGSRSGASLNDKGELEIDVSRYMP